MKTLYFDELPRDIEALKDQNVDGIGIAGSMVYLADVFKALVRYSSYDCIALPARSRTPGDIRDNPVFHRYQGRISFLAEHELSTLRNADQLVIASGGPDLMGLHRKRCLIGRPHTPLTGIIHSINFTSQYFPAMLGFFFSPLSPFDALICSSSAGLAAIEKFKAVMRERFAGAGLMPYEPRWQTPLIPLGVDTDTFSITADVGELRQELAAEGKSVLLYFGRFSAASKADLFPLLIALSAVIKRHSDSVLILAGDDTQYRIAPDLQAFAADLGCQEHVRVLPNPTTARKHQLYAMADVFVSLADSLQETFGLTLVEAMAAGLPVVASDWDGYRDLVCHGETGFLVPTYMPDYPVAFDRVRGSGATNIPDLLASSTIVDLAAVEAHLDELLANDGLRKRLGAAARKRAQLYFDWRRIIARYEELWDSLIEQAAECPAPTGSLGLDIGQWGFREIFGHYGTTFVTPDARLRVTGLGRSPDAVGSLMRKVAMPESWFLPARSVEILTLVNASPDMSVFEVLTRATGQGHDYTQTLGIVCRLAKYGLVSVAAAQRLEQEAQPDGGTGTFTSAGMQR